MTCYHLSSVLRAAVTEKAGKDIKGSATGEGAFGRGLEVEEKVLREGHGVTASGRWRCQGDGEGIF